MIGPRSEIEPPTILILPKPASGRPQLVTLESPPPMINAHAHGYICAFGQVNGSWGGKNYGCLLIHI